MVRRRHDLLVDAQGVVATAGVRGEKCEEEVEFSDHDRVATLSAVDVGEREVVLGADIVEVLAGERVRTEQGAAICASMPRQVR